MNSNEFIMFVEFRLSPLKGTSKYMADQTSLHSFPTGHYVQAGNVASL